MIKKIREKFGEKHVEEVNEAYTSKVDSLAYEEIGKHTNYQGTRICRGLYMSSIGKLINADVNGSINIMRKYIKGEKEEENLKEILKKKNVYNPRKVNVFRKV